MHYVILAGLVRCDVVNVVEKDECIIIYNYEFTNNVRVSMLQIMEIMF